MCLRIQLADDPYSLTQDELMEGKNKERFNEKIEYLLKDALIKKALVQVRN